eukprot:jgi/Ulvmu1/11217/UM072_0054.1
MKKLKDLVAQKRKAIEDKQKTKRAKLSEGVRDESLDGKVIDKNHEVAPSSAVSTASPVPDAAAAVPDRQHSVLADVEVRRRLRRLGHPVTLFGEIEGDRHERYRHVERTVEVTDEGAIGGESANVLLTILKEDRQKAKEAAVQSGNDVDESKATPPAQEGNASAEGEMTEEEKLLRQFQEAAERFKVQKEMDSLPTEQRIIARLKKYMQEWKEDLNARPQAAVNTTIGLQATNGFRQAEKAFETLYTRLRDSEVHEEIVSCLVMILRALDDRHYQRANEIYLQLSIGNQTWPIGVTSIGIHDRTAREKLSFYANVKSQAHIMNDEATRKYLHGISRLIQATQRLRPADPSRSSNFNAVEHAGLGAKSGNQKKRLLEIKQNGEDDAAPVAPPVAPEFFNDDGSVQVPRAWGNMLRAEAQQGAQGS